MARALKAADVGIAMGLKGTGVANEAAQAVLADDDFVTIGHGVFEGGKFFDNLRKGVSYYLAVKVGCDESIRHSRPVTHGQSLPGG